MVYNTVIIHQKTKMEQIGELVIKAIILKRSGNIEGSLVYFSDAFDLLVKEAMNYALRFEEPKIDVDGQEKINPLFAARVHEFYKLTDVACKISTNIGAIFLEMGNLEAAKDFFYQAIDLTPDGLDFNEPLLSLQEIENCLDK